MTGLVKFALGLGVPERFAKAAVIAALVTLGALATFAAVKLHDHRVISGHDTKRENTALKADQKASSDAADQRATDTIAIARNAQETRDAIQAQPDQPIAPTSRALACKRLRNAGRDVPACR